MRHGRRLEGQRQKILGGQETKETKVPELRKVRQKKPGWPRTYWDESILDSTAPVLSWVDPLSTPGVLSQVPHQSLPPAPGDTQHPPNHPPLDGLAVMSVLSLVAILGTTAKTAGNFLGQKKPSEPSHPSGWERESFSTVHALRKLTIYWW